MAITITDALPFDRFGSSASLRTAGHPMRLMESLISEGWLNLRLNLSGPGVQYSDPWCVRGVLWSAKRLKAMGPSSPLEDGCPVMAHAARFLGPTWPLVHYFP